MESRGTPRSPRDFLFGAACVAGGLILRPGHPTRVVCGNGGDCGGYCHQFCPATDVQTPVEGKACPSPSSWAPQDIHIYLQRETAERRRGDYRNNAYNEFLVDGRWWEKHLPDAIDAIFTGDGANRQATDQAGSGMSAREVHAAFLKEYGLTSDDVPLLEWTGDVQTPLRRAGSCDEEDAIC